MDTQDHFIFMASTNHIIIRFKQGLGSNAHQAGHYTLTSHTLKATRKVAFLFWNHRVKIKSLTLKSLLFTFEATFYSHKCQINASL